MSKKYENKNQKYGDNRTTACQHGTWGIYKKSQIKKKKNDLRTGRTKNSRETRYVRIPQKSPNTCTTDNGCVGSLDGATTTLAVRPPRSITTLSSMPTDLLRVRFFGGSDDFGTRSFLPPPPPPQPSAVLQFDSSSPPPMMSWNWSGKKKQRPFKYRRETGHPSSVVSSRSFLLPRQIRAELRTGELKKK